MKSFLMAMIFLSFTTPTFSKTISIKGLKAKALLDIGTATNSTEAAMGGKTFMELRNVECVKIVDNNYYVFVQRCKFRAFEDIRISSDQEPNRNTPEELRSALIEIANNEIIVNDIKKTINVDLIKCFGHGFGHTLDNLNIERSYECSLTFK